MLLVFELLFMHVYVLNPYPYPLATFSVIKLLLRKTSGLGGWGKKTAGGNG